MCLGAAQPDVLQLFGCQVAQVFARALAQAPLGDHDCETDGPLRQNGQGGAAVEVSHMGGGYMCSVGHRGRPVNCIDTFL